MISRRAFVGAAVLSLAGCAPSPSPQRRAATTGLPPRRPAVPAGPAGTRLTDDTSTPLTPLAHLMTAPATMNGQGAYRFAIDTGSAASLRVSTELAARLPQIGVVQEGDPSGQGSRAVPVVRVDSLMIGAAEFTGVEASVGVDLGDIRPDGIIGVGLFEQLTATFDYPRRTLRLSRDRVPAGPHVTPIISPQGVPRIDIRAGDITLLADVDTGGPALLTVPRSAGLPFQSEPTRTGTGQTTNGTFDIWSAQLVGDLSVAGWNTHAPVVDVVDALPVASIGAAFLRDYAVTFDLPAGHLELTR